MSKLNKLTRLARNPAYLRTLWRHGVAAGVENFKALASLCRDDPCLIVDIGANRGQFALVARKCFPRAKIISFEPLKEPAAIFRKVFAGDAFTMLHEMAIGPCQDEMPIHVSRADDSSSLLSISDLQNKLFPGTAEKEVRTIQVKPLDAVLTAREIQAPALLKIDVQGYEREVLEGCQSLLPCFSAVYVECSFMELYEGQALAHKIIAFLEGFGFALTGVYNMCYDKRGMAIQGDFLFQQR